MKNIWWNNLIDNKYVINKNTYFSFIWFLLIINNFDLFNKKEKEELINFFISSSLAAWKEVDYSIFISKIFNTKYKNIIWNNEKADWFKNLFSSIKINFIEIELFTNMLYELKDNLYFIFPYIFWWFKTNFYKYTGIKYKFKEWNSYLDKEISFSEISENERNIYERIFKDKFINTMIWYSKNFFNTTEENLQEIYEIMKNKILNKTIKTMKNELETNLLDTLNNELENNIKNIKKIWKIKSKIEKEKMENIKKYHELIAKDYENKFKNNK